MYDVTAPYYDLIHSWKDYIGESPRLVALIDEVRPGSRSLLDAACGTGRHLELLQERFDVAGVDGSSEMLRVARSRLGDIPLHQGDVREFELKRRFDVITCLFGSIVLVKSLDQAGRAIKNMVAHLADDGLIILEPWVVRENFQDRFVDASVLETSQAKVCLASVSQLDGDVAQLDMQYLIATADEITHLQEPLTAGVWSIDEYVSLLKEAGLDVTHDPVGLDRGRGLFIGVRR